MKAAGMKIKAPIVHRPPEFPRALQHVWDWFLEILQGVSGGGMSVPVITWTELDCWSRLTGRDIAPRDARTLVRLGVLRASILAEKADGDKS